MSNAEIICVPAAVTAPPRAAGVPRALALAAPAVTATTAAATLVMIQIRRTVLTSNRPEAATEV
jgi:hypothetical protein